VTLDHAEVFVALAIPGVLALWRGASLRGDMRKEWSPRVEDAEVGLTDRATKELLEMQQEITDLMGSGPASLPRLATVDPGQLSKQIHNFQKTMAAASRLQSHFRWLLRVGPLLIIASLLFLVGIGALFANHSELASSEAMRLGGVIAVTAGGVLGVVIAIAWVLLHFRLSGAELRATEASE
jgi:nitrate reductase gamma subunit